MYNIFVTVFLAAFTVALCFASGADSTIHFAASGNPGAQYLPIVDKTLVVWAIPSNLTQRGGSALTIEDTHAHFDGIVFGEIAPTKWMAGSDFYNRTQKDQSDYPPETAMPGSLLQLAIVYRGDQVTIYHAGKEYARYSIQKPQEFEKDSFVLIGIRHLETNDGASFTGKIEDARVYNVALTENQIAALKPGELSNPKPLAWWNFKVGLQDQMGVFPYGALTVGAHISGGKLVLDDEGSCFIAHSSAAPPPYNSPIHYRPVVGALADTIPIYYKGHYNVFYLHAAIAGTPWEHIVSSDLIHWKELPTALKPNRDDPNGPDGGNMFTGNVIEHNGVFHIFYTGHNPSNPHGIEQICHAVSNDGIKWTKHPEDMFGADGIHYMPKSDFRDPYVFWNEKEKRFWMLLCAREAGSGKPVVGVACSQDLIKWRQIKPLTLDPPLNAGTPECPDLFKCGKTWYLLHSPCAGTTDVRWAKSLSGPWRQPAPFSIDTSILYAAKRMYDGKRQILVGWIRDLAGGRDSGGEMWGGTQCLPREAHEGTDGQLYFKPAKEIVDDFTKVYLKTKLTIRPNEPAAMEAPDNYMLDCHAKLAPHTEFTIAFRQQEDGATSYRLTLRSEMHEAEISGPGFHSSRACTIDTAQPVKIQAFLQGTILECFINDRYAFSWRTYDLSHGKIGLSASGGIVEIESLQVRLAKK